MSKDAIRNVRSVLIATAAATLAPVATAAAVAGLQPAPTGDWRMPRPSIATSTVQPGLDAVAARRGERRLVAQAITGPYPPLGYDPGGPGRGQAGAVPAQGSAQQPATAPAPTAAVTAPAVPAGAPQLPQASVYPPQGAAAVFAPYPQRPYWAAPQPPSQWQAYPPPPNPGFAAPAQAVPMAPAQQPTAARAQPFAPTHQPNTAVHPARPQMAPAWQKQPTWQQGTWQQRNWQAPPTWQAPPPPPGYGYPGWGAPPPAPYQPSTWSAPHTSAPGPASPQTQPPAARQATATPTGGANPQPAYYSGPGPTGSLDGQAGFAVNAGFGIGGSAGAGSPWTPAPQIEPALAGRGPASAAAPQTSTRAPQPIVPATNITAGEPVVAGQPPSVYAPIGYLHDRPSWGGVIAAPAVAGPPVPVQPSSDPAVNFPAGNNSAR